MPHPLDSFFAPDSIALIGASRDLEKIPGRLLSMLRKNEYPGKIYPINPNYPIPSASVRTAVAVNTRATQNCRTA